MTLQTITTEYSHSDEIAARALRQTFIDEGLQVSLLAYDPDRGLYAFDVIDKVASR